MDSQFGELESVDWDILLILDATRWDVWKDIVGTGYPVESPASSSDQWVQKFVESFDTSGVMCVTANPEVTRHTSSWDFKKREDFWKNNWEQINGVSTVDDRKVVSAIERVMVTEDWDRIYGHLMGSHWPYPFCDPPVPALRCNPQATDVDVDHEEVPDHIIWDVVEAVGDDEHFLTEELLMEGYRENLKHSYGAIQSLLDSDNTVVVTADHGELLLDEPGLYGHPPGSEHELVRKVPFEVVR